MEFQIEVIFQIVASLVHRYVIYLSRHTVTFLCGRYRPIQLERGNRYIDGNLLCFDINGIVGEKFDAFSQAQACNCYFLLNRQNETPISDEYAFLGHFTILRREIHR